MAPDRETGVFDADVAVVEHDGPQFRVRGRFSTGREADGIIISHMRTEDDGLIEGALEELVSYGDGAVSRHRI